MAEEAFLVASSSLTASGGDSTVALTAHAVMFGSVTGTITVLGEADLVAGAVLFVSPEIIVPVPLPLPEGFVLPEIDVFGFLTEEGAINMLAVFAGEAPPTYLYAALCRTVPTPYQHSADLDEVDDLGYVRIAVVNGITWTAYQGQLFNNLEIVWPTGTGDIRGWALMDAPHGGRVLYAGDWGSVTTITTGYTAIRASMAVPMAITDWALEG